MTDTLLLFIQLFTTFFIIGLFTFGGGYAMLSLIQTQVVTAHGWLSESTFTEIVAISQMTPGPIGINCATYVGYDVVRQTGAGAFLGTLGSFTATFALVLPSFIIVLLMARFYMKFRENRLYSGMMEWVRPVVCGLIGAAAVILIVKTSWSGVPLFSGPSFEVVRDNFPDWKSWVLFGAALVAGFTTKAGPILLIAAGGLAGLLIY